jgi:hypothetical protein
MSQPTNNNMNRKDAIHHHVDVNEVVHDQNRNDPEQPKPQPQPQQQQQQQQQQPQPQKQSYQLSPENQNRVNRIFQADHGQIGAKIAQDDLERQQQHQQQQLQQQQSSSYLQFSPDNQSRVNRIFQADIDQVAEKIANEAVTRHSNSDGKKPNPHDRLITLEERIANKTAATLNHHSSSSQLQNDNMNHASFTSLDARELTDTISNDFNNSSTTTFDQNRELANLDDRIAMKLASGSMQSPMSSPRRQQQQQQHRSTAGTIYEEELIRSKELIAAASSSPNGGGSVRSLLSVRRYSNNTLSNSSNDIMMNESNRSFNGRPQDSKLTATQSPSGRSMGDCNNRRHGAFAVPSLPPLHPTSGTIPVLERGAVIVPKFGYADESSSSLEKDEYQEQALANGESLAVALPVLEEEEDEYDEKFLPAAIEFDPDQKVAEIKKNRSRMIIYLLFVIIVIMTSVVIGIVIAMKSNDDNESNVNTTNYVNPREQGIKELIINQMSKYDESILSDNDTTNPFYMAFHWITNIDPLQLTPDIAPNFLQRFVVAYLYYVTSKEREWEYCAPPPSSNITDIDNVEITCRTPFNCLRTTDCSYKKDQIPWLSNYAECDWAGITCDDNGNILEIEIGTFCFI